MITAKKLDIAIGVSLVLLITGGAIGDAEAACSANGSGVTCTSSETYNNGSGVTLSNSSNKPAFTINSASAGQTYTIVNNGTFITTDSGTTNAQGLDIYRTNAPTIVLTNNGLIQSGSGSAAIRVTQGTGSPSLTIGNYGTITGGNNLSLNNGSSVNTTLTNYSSGVMNGTIYNGGTITSLTNLGTIVSSTYGIQNGGIITTINNAQGEGNSSGSLKYTGALPANYSVIINSPSSYGRLEVTSGTGSTTFSINNTSSVSNDRKYTSVLSGLTTANIANISGSTVSGTYSGFSWILSQSASSTTTWDLCFGNCNSTTSSIYSGYVTSSNNPAAIGAANALGQVTNPTGSMATLINYLDGSATDQQKSNAISQTLPVIVGAAPAATVNTQRSLTQIVQARQSQAAGLSSGEEFIVNKDVWMKGFGVWGKQNDLNGVSGYKLSTGGLAIGGDRALSPRANIGGVIAFANSNVNGNNPAAPNSMVINSYQIGGYGDYAVTDRLNYNYQVDFGINQNKGTRNILTAGVIASSNYYSYSGHLGSGLKYMMPVVEKLTFIPSARVDYTQVQSNAYSETGAGTLNLQTNSQKYEEFLVSADLRFDYDFNKKLKGTINGGVAYNTMNNQVQITSIYQGGGPSFTTNGMQVSPTLYEGGFGIIGNITKDVELIARYDAQYRTTGYFSQMASIRAKINF